ncbi:MAG: tRNA (N6-threonylcarbamoyladenosine(37)-N6)-methyltransferase TrmO [Desulfobacteraceae bacterium]
MNQIVYQSIGTIRTPFKELSGMPIQPRGDQSAKGELVVDPAYEPGLRDIEGFSHLILIYHFHKSRGFELTVKPFLDDHHRGVFATRAPRRPNAIGLSIVSLLERSGNVLRVGGIDVADQTPLLDIKPYVPMFDAPEATAIGWLEGKAENFREKKSDRRFLKQSDS